MNIDSRILDELSAQAAESPRLRKNYDLRTTPGDGSQRMLNALEPGTCVPVHRHNGSTEVVTMIRGRAIQYFYDDSGNLTDAVLLVPPGEPACEKCGFEVSSICSMMSVEVGRWHRLQPLAHGTIIFECKDGAYEPLGEEDIMDI